jgi:hypothetical protein
MRFKTLTLDRNNITLSYISNDLIFCNDCNELNKLNQACDRQTDRHDKKLYWLYVTAGSKSKNIWEGAKERATK